MNRSNILKEKTLDRLGVHFVCGFYFMGTTLTFPRILVLDLQLNTHLKSNAQGVAIPYYSLFKYCLKCRLDLDSFSSIGEVWISCQHQ